MGALQFTSVDYGVPAPQSLTRQLQTDDDRTRAASLSAIGAPGQYLVRGHIPYPHSVQLDFVALGSTDELDAILTVELDQHMVSAILLPEDGNWRRIATVIYPTAFADPTTTPSTFLRIARSLMQHERYRAIYHATSATPGGDFTENEAHLRILNNRAVIVISFASDARVCDARPGDTRPSDGRPGDSRPGDSRPGDSKPGQACELTHRWLQPDPTDPQHRFTLVTASGRLSPREAADPLVASHTFLLAHLRSFSCQPFAYSDASQRYEPTANSKPCPSSR
jgi:hypothetical protein